MTGEVWRVRDKQLTLGRAVMGVLNLTPDSFSDGGQLMAGGGSVANTTVVVRRARRMVEAGAVVLDLGGESTRPGATPVSPQDEVARVLPALEAVRRELPGVVISVDTRHALTARACAQAGADVLNDVSCLRDPLLAAVAAEFGLGVVISHSRHDPLEMQRHTEYGALLEEIAEDLRVAVGVAQTQGVALEAIVVDPGIGFGKDAQDSAALVLSGAKLRAATGRPVLVGASRKRFLEALTGEATAERRDPASVVAAVLALHAGASMVRVHDVAATVSAAAVWHGCSTAARDRLET